MKKVRVYELAKEIGMESKALTAKLIDLGYNVKAYNSTLDGEMAASIRAEFGDNPLKENADEKKTSDTVPGDVTVTSTSTVTIDSTEVEDKRIQAKGRTTIIRRRRKQIQPEPEMAAEPAIEEPESATPEPPVKEDEVVAEQVEPTVVKETEEAHALEEKEQVTEPVPEVEPIAEVEEMKETAKAAEELETKEEEPVSEAKEEPTPAAVDETPTQVKSEPELAEKETEKTTSEKKVDKPISRPAAEKEEKPAPKKKAPEPAKVAPERKGLARIIKRAAIQIPVEEKRTRPNNAPKGGRPKGKKPGPPYEKTQGYKGTPGGGGPAMKAAAPPRDAEKAAGKGKKGKRFVKFHHEDAGKGKRGAKRKGFADVDMEDVAMAGGRFSAALKVGRGPRGGKKGKQAQVVKASETKQIKKRIKIYETITIGDLAHRMGVKANEVIAKLMGLGVMATVNQSLDADTVTLVASDFGYEVEQAVTEELSIVNLEDQESGGEMQPRPPVVTVMGHVDHGKTSILDAIRSTDVAEGEAGGITQHIGAHYVRSRQGDVVFLDTPGHAAFTEMRSRGAKVTDIVVLVVAADDGVMDQTKEAINHAKAAEVPIVVAVNKIDKEDADPMRVKRELAEFDLVPEEWGGETIYCETSAKRKIGIDDLLEQILLQAEILELQADKNRKARGRVVEAKLHKGRGPVATILIQQGTLRSGDCFVVGKFYGKVRSLLSDKGQRIKEGSPSWPVEVQGINGVPSAGDEFVVVNDEKMAKSVASERQMKSRESQLGLTSKVSLDNLFEKLQEGGVKELNVLLRADVQGTLEAFGKAIGQLSTDEIKLKIVHEGTGAIIDSDVLLAAASDAIIIGFNVRPSTKVQEFAAKENVDVRYYDVIYHALDDIKKAMAGLLDPVFVERVIGSVEIRDTFSVPKIGTIAGCYVADGKVERNAEVRLVRDGVVVYTGNITSLRRFKDDVKEVATGYECGIGLENYNDIKVGDTLEIYVMDEVAAKL